MITIQYVRQFSDDIFKLISLHANCCIALRFISGGQIINDHAMVQMTVWRRKGNKPLSEPKGSLYIDCYMRHSASMSQLQRWFVTSPENYYTVCNYISTLYSQIRHRNKWGSGMNTQIMNSSFPGQIGRRFVDISKCILIHEKFCISTRISLNFVPKSPFDINTALV